MSCFLVAVVDHSRARLFTFEDSDFPEQSPPALIEQKDFTNEASRQMGQDLWSNSQSGHNRSAVSHTYGYDDHRQNHLREFERRFASEVTGQLQQMQTTCEPTKLVLVAEPQILGILRETIQSCPLRSLRCEELAKDISKLSVSQIHQYLADKALLPPPYRAVR